MLRARRKGSKLFISLSRLCARITAADEVSLITHSQPTATRVPNLSCFPRTDCDHDLALGLTASRCGARHGRSLRDLLLSLVGLPSDPSQSAKPFSGHHLLSIPLQP